MKKMQKQAIMVSALVALLGASSAWATYIDYGTHGDWIGKYGSKGYIIAGYNGQAGFAIDNPYTGALNLASLAGAPVTGYSVAVQLALEWGNVPARAAGSPSLQDPNSPADGTVNADSTGSGGAPYPLAVSLTLAPNTAAFRMAIYLLKPDSAPPSPGPAGGSNQQTVSLDWNGGPVFDFETVSGYQQFLDGTWVVFDVPANGANTTLDITFTSPNHTSPGNDVAFSAIMFDAIPEPSTIALLGIGGFLLWLRRRSR